MAQVPDYKTGVAKANIYVYPNTSGTSSGTQVAKGSTMRFPLDDSYGIIYSNGLARTTSPVDGWVNMSNVGSLKTVYKTVTDACTPPSSVTLDVDAKQLTISGGSGGDLNTFEGWGVSWRERPENGDTWGEWSADTVTTTNGVTVSVNAGMVRQFQVRTRGSAGEKYYSAYVECPTLLVGITAASAPTNITATNASPAPGTTITINWTGAAAGVSNPITGYELWQSSTSDGTYSLVKSVSTTETSGNTTFTSDLSIGETLYLKVKTIGTTSGYDSELSSFTLSITGGYGLVTAPTTVQVSSAKHYANGIVRLEWSGAADGYENPVKGYEIYRSSNPNSGYTLIANIASGTKAFVNAPAANGGVYYYKVKTIGTANGFNSALSSVYATLTAAAYTYQLIGRTNAVM